MGTVFFWLLACFMFDNFSSTYIVVVFYRVVCFLYGFLYVEMKAAPFFLCFVYQDIERDMFFIGFVCASVWWLLLCEERRPFPSTLYSLLSTLYSMATILTACRLRWWLGDVRLMVVGAFRSNAVSSGPEAFTEFQCTEKTLNQWTQWLKNH